MMSKKKVMLLVLVLALVTLVASAKLNDGTYSVRGKVDSHGYYPSITLVVKGNKIASVDYKEIASAENKPKAKGVYPHAAYFTAIETLNKKAVEVNGDLDKLDAVAGATHTSDTFKEMLFWALVKATPLKNTTYKGINYPADSRGYKPTMQVTVQNGKVTKIEYAEVQEADGKAKAKGVYKYDAYFDAIETLPKKIVEAGGIPTEVDGFAGATSTSTKFFELYKAYMTGIYQKSK